MFSLLIGAFSLFCTEPIEKEFRENGYIEIGVSKPPQTTFDILYSHFNELIIFLQNHPQWAQKLYSAKERFIRSKARQVYGTDFFGYFDESTNERRSQIAFYYACDFHEFLCSYYPDLQKEPPILNFLTSCHDLVQNPSEVIFKALAADFFLTSETGSLPLLLKVVKYLPHYAPSAPHYDGTAFSLLLDSTDNNSLLLSPFKTTFTTEDFKVPLRSYSRENSMLLIPGIQLTEFSIYPTPHIVLKSGSIRYAAITFCMRPPASSQKIDLPFLPTFD